MRNAYQYPQSVYVDTLERVYRRRRSAPRWRRAIFGGAALTLVWLPVCLVTTSLEVIAAAARWLVNVGSWAQVGALDTVLRASGLRAEFLVAMEEVLRERGTFGCGAVPLIPTGDDVPAGLRSETCACCDGSGQCADCDGSGSRLLPVEDEPTEYTYELDGSASCNGMPTPDAMGWDLILRSDGTGTLWLRRRDGTRMFVGALVRNGPPDFHPGIAVISEWNFTAGNGQIYVVRPGDPDIAVDIQSPAPLGLKATLRQRGA